MKNDTTLTTRPPRTAAIQKQKDEVAETERREIRLVADIPRRHHKRIKSMSGRATDPNCVGQSVSMKDLLVEAIEDWFEKYDRGEGYYTIEEDD